MLCFLDIDGVISFGGDVLDHGLVANLERLLAAFPNLRIVLNTAWNRIPLNDMQEAFRLAGLSCPHRIWGQTAGNGGGGGLARQWRLERASTEPYILIDDSGNYDTMMWGRLVHTDPQKGFDSEKLDEALALCRRPITVAGEREALLANLSREVARLSDRAPWLTTAQRLEYVSHYVAMWAKVVSCHPGMLLHEIGLKPDDQP